MTFDHSDFGPIDITKETWENAVEAFARFVGHRNFNPIYCLDLMGICPAGIFSPLSHELLRVYAACDGTKRIATPREYYSLPAIYVDAVDVISNAIKDAKKWLTPQTA